MKNIIQYIHTGHTRCPVWISPNHWPIVAIREHVVAEDALAGAGKLVRVDESANLGVVITAAEVIQSQLDRTSVCIRKCVSW